MQKNECGPLPNTYAKADSKWIKYLNVRSETIKLLEDNTGQNFTTLDLAMIFLI